MADLKVGKVTHFYDKLGVAIIELSGSLGIGDNVKFIRGGEDLFEQKIDSMQVEHTLLKEAKKGQVIGLKVDQEVKVGAELYKIGK